MKYRAIVYLYVVAGLLTGVNAGDEWQPIARLVPADGNYAFRGSYTVQDGFTVRFFSKADTKAVAVTLRKASTMVSDWTGTPGKRQEHYVSWPDNLPPGDDPSLDVVVKIRQSQWWVYLNNRPVLTLQPPFALPASLHVRQKNALNDRRVKFQKVTPFSFAAEFMDVEEGTKKLANWEQSGGSWKLHTVMQDALEQHTSKKLEDRPVVPTHSPNFYSLEGSGKGMLLTGYPFEDNYRVRASIQTGPVESGLVFYYQDKRNYYTFGLAGMRPDDEKAWFKLIRYSSSAALSARTTLAVVQVDLTNGQWVMPEVRANNSRLTCYIDNRQVIELEEDLPVGGRYGLYVDDEDENGGIARYDDVNVTSVTALPLPDLKRVRFHTIDSENDIYEQESSILQFLKGNNRNPMNQQWIESSISGKARWLAIGHADHAPHEFGANFNVRSRVFDIGLLIAFKGRQKPYYRYRCTYDGEMLRTLCEEVRKEQVKTLVERTVPFPSQQLGERHKLAAVTSDDNLVKLYFNDDLVFVQEIEHADGASGVYLGQSTQSRISDFIYRFKPALEYVNKYEKNPVFVTDPFMKHWSSPEGEWFTDPTTKETWHKSDFFGEYSLTMPWVVGSEIHLSVEEQKKEGQAFLRVAPDGRLQLIYREKVVMTTDLPDKLLNDLEVKAGKKAAYTVHYGGQAIWVTSGKEVLGFHHLKYSLKGSRVRVKGFNQTHLATTLSRRHNVYDALFTQALHDWNVGGGKWQVINRFQCKPTFSHLNGENADGPAFLWSKHTFQGDFCVEFYVGLRHGDWYKMSGRDFNLTIMNDEASPASGYTVTCAGWDPNELQKFTRLYRNGELVKSSETYTAPQVRSGNKRKLFDPVIQRGRDVHGAWYYIKLRRRGSKLEYFFDNEKILSWNDPNPIDVGSLGIWTYRNSMMVARVKVSAESIQPSWFPIRSMTKVPARPEPAKLLPSMELTANGYPVDIMRPEIWKSEPLSTHCIATWEPGGALNSPSVTQKATSGGGSMLLESNLPMLPLRKVSGIRFSVKRTAGTQFNFYYNLHQSNVKGSVPIERYMVKLSGSGDDRPDWKISGSSDLPALSLEAFNRSGGWTDVTVWFPTHLTDPSGHFINVIGFGNIDPSYIQQGLEGNKPGARYAICNAGLIFNEAPSIQWRSKTAGAFRLRGVMGHRYSKITNTTDAIRLELVKEQRPGLNASEITFDNPDLQLQPVNLFWNNVPDEPEISVEWHPKIPYAVKLKNSNHAPEFSVSTIMANQKPMTFEEVTAGEYIGFLPVSAIEDALQVNLTYRLKGHTKTASLDYGASPAGVYPVLPSLAGPTALVIDGDTISTPLIGNSMTRYLTSERRHLVFQNRKYGERLVAGLNRGLQLPRFPIMAFRYNCDPSAQVSINLGLGKVEFTEAVETTAQQVRYASPLRNGAWQSWMGTISDLEFSQPYSKSSLRLSRLQFGSTSTIDQTGRYSRLGIDNLVVGPVVNDAKALEFTPTFTCPGGVKLVEYTVISGSGSFHDLNDNDRKNLVWSAVPNGEAFVPNLDYLRHPVGRLVIRAASSKGILSQPFEIPFMMDRVAPEGQAEFAMENVPGTNGTFLNLTYKTQSQAPDDGGAPVDLSKLQILADDKPLELGSGTIRLKHTGASDTLLVDWPYLLRHTLSPERKQVTLTVKGVGDGAGNPADDLSVVVAQPDKDKVSPTWISLDTTGSPSINQAFVFPWTNPKAPQPTFQGSRATTARYTHLFNQAPFVRLRGYKTSIYGWLQVAPGKWNLNTHPYISLAARLPRGGVNTAKFYVELKGQGEAALKFPLELTSTDGAKLSNDWHYFTFDVKEKIRRYIKRRNLNKDFEPRIWHVSIQGAKTSNNLEMDVKDVVIHSSWTEKDTLRLDTYDASAISHCYYQIVRGETVIQEGKLAGTTVNPHGLAVNGATGDWLLFYSVDTKGNRSHPIRLPIVK